VFLNFRISKNKRPFYVYNHRTNIFMWLNLKFELPYTRSQISMWNDGFLFMKGYNLKKTHVK
jgi:hypothetical protein